MSIEGKIESILFVASKPISLGALAKALHETPKEIEMALTHLEARYLEPNSGLRLLRRDQDVQLATDPANVDAIEGFVREEATGELTRAQLETLTVVAYRGPVTRPEIEQIRGVNCAVIIRILQVRGLIEEQENRALAMPVYTISFDALGHLGIRSVMELPEYEKLHTHENIEQLLKQD